MFVKEQKIVLYFQRKWFKRDFLFVSELMKPFVEGDLVYYDFLCVLFPSSTMNSNEIIMTTNAIMICFTKVSFFLYIVDSSTYTNEETSTPFIHLNILCAPSTTMMTNKRGKRRERFRFLGSSILYPGSKRMSLSTGKEPLRMPRRLNH